MQPAAGLLVVGRALLVVAHFAGGAVQHVAVHQPDHPAMAGIHRQNGMQEQPGTGVVGVSAEALLAGVMVRETQIRGVVDGKRVPAADPPAGQTSGMRQHFLRGDRGIGQETAELPGLAAVGGQSMQAQGPFA